jgi:hypothetical protein
MNTIATNIISYIGTTRSYKYKYQLSYRLGAHIVSKYWGYENP